MNFSSFSLHRGHVPFWRIYPLPGVSARCFAQLPGARNRQAKPGCYQRCRKIQSGQTGVDRQRIRIVLRRTVATSDGVSECRAIGRHYRFTSAQITDDRISSDFRRTHVILSRLMENFAHNFPPFNSLEKVKGISKSHTKPIVEF